jgi:hypothetical protein
MIKPKICQTFNEVIFNAATFPHFKDKFLLKLFPLLSISTHVSLQFRNLTSSSKLFTQNGKQNTKGEKTRRWPFNSVQTDYHWLMSRLEQTHLQSIVSFERSKND